MVYFRNINKFGHYGGTRRPNICCGTRCKKFENHCYRQNEFVLINKLKRAAETSSERLRQVFNETCREDPANISVTSRQMESIMCKRRRKLLPPLPLIPGDFCQVIPDSPFVHLCKGSVNSGGAYAVIFSSDFMLMK